MLKCTNILFKVLGIILTANFSSKAMKSKRRTWFIQYSKKKHKNFHWKPWPKIYVVILVSFKAGVPSLWDLMPDDLRWTWYNNRNEAHNKFNVLESSWNNSPNLGPRKNSLPQNWSLVPKRLGATDLKNAWRWKALL